jgi:hypothetical protein
LEIAEIFLADDDLIKVKEYIDESRKLLFRNDNLVEPLQLARLYKTIGLFWNGQEKH